eukprot:scaffold156_cov308-Prasinococcus_capsulatus_cf.AAC.12
MTLAGRPRRAHSDVRRRRGRGESVAASTANIATTSAAHTDGRGAGADRRGGAACKRPPRRRCACARARGFAFARVLTHDSVAGFATAQGRRRCRRST